jgi:elongation factor Ts
MSFTAADVKELRERTGAGMMDCKKALVETDGDLEKAMEWLQIKGIAKAAKKADRVAADGLVGAFISADGTLGALVEVNCETDFVARNDDFKAFVADVARLAVENKADSIEALLAVSAGEGTLEDLRQSRVASIGENISIRRVSLVHQADGFLSSYLHNGGVKGAIVAISTGGATPSGELLEAGRNLCMHVVASAPRFTTQAEIDDSVLETERRLQTEQALESGKPREIVDKMIEGRLRKWKQEICLVDQPFVMNPDVTVSAYVSGLAKNAGIKASVVSFLTFTRGEGIEKQTSNLAEEVARMTQG